MNGLSAVSCPRERHVQRAGTALFVGQFVDCTARPLHSADLTSRALRDASTSSTPTASGAADRHRRHRLRLQILQRNHQLQALDALQGWGTSDTEALISFVANDKVPVLGPPPAHVTDPSGRNATPRPRLQLLLWPLVHDPPAQWCIDRRRYQGRAWPSRIPSPQRQPCFSERAEGGLRRLPTPSTCCRPVMIHYKPQQLRGAVPDRRVGHQLVFVEQFRRLGRLHGPDRRRRRPRHHYPPTSGRNNRDHRDGEASIFVGPFSEPGPGRHEARAQIADKRLRQPKATHRYIRGICASAA